MVECGFNAEVAENTKKRKHYTEDTERIEGTEKSGEKHKEKGVSVGVCGDCGAAECREVHAAEPVGGAEGGDCDFEAADDPESDSGDCDAGGGADCFY